MQRTLLSLVAGLLIVAAVLFYLNFARTSMQQEPRGTPARYDDMIEVDAPLRNASVASPLEVSGKARGGWYFEASFPVLIYDDSGKLLGSTPARAEGDWMTQEYVPFLATLHFDPPTTQEGVLVVQNDNPSGLPEHQKELRIPVTFGDFEQGALSQGTSMKIKLYYYDPAQDTGPGGPSCSEKGLVALERNIPKTVTPLSDSIRLLLRGELTSEEKARGITTEFPLPGVALQKASITDGTATLIFDDPQHATSGGSCRVLILKAQIDATAKQFSTVTSVRFEPESLFQP